MRGCGRHLARARRRRRRPAKLVTSEVWCARRAALASHATLANTKCANESLNSQEERRFRVLRRRVFI